MNSYNWTLPNSVFVNIEGKDYDFNQQDSPYDLTEIIEDSWVQDAIARGYFVPESEESEEDSTEA